jgi:hypothetical protein
LDTPHTLYFKICELKERERENELRRKDKNKEGKNN